MRIRDWWKSLPPEQKELAFAGIHGTVLAMIISAMRKEGLSLLSLARQRPGLLLGGMLLGGAYYSIVKRLVIGT